MTAPFFGKAQVSGHTDLDALWANAANAAVAATAAVATANAALAAVSGGALTVQNVNTNTVLTVADVLVRVDTSLGSITITLPASAGLGGQTVIVEKIDGTTNTVTVAAHAGDVMAGAGGGVWPLSAQWQSATFIGRSGGWDVSGSTGSAPLFGIVSITTNTTALARSINYRCDASGGAIALTLPPVTPATPGVPIAVVKIDASANGVTINGNGATINGSATLVLTAQWQGAILVPSGSAWDVIGFVPAGPTSLPPLALLLVSTSTVVARGGIEVRADATGGAFPVTLPAAASVLGQLVAVAKIDSAAHNVTITGAGGDTINGSATLALTAQWSSALLVARTGGWDVLAQNTPGGVATITTGTWTPTDASGASLAITANGCNWWRIGSGSGSMVLLQGILTFPSTADTSSVVIAGIPVAAAVGNGQQPMGAAYGATGTVIPMTASINFGTANGSQLTFVGALSGHAGQLTNANLSTAAVQFSLAYVT